MEAKGAFFRLFFVCARQMGTNPRPHTALGQQHRVFWAPWGGMTRQGEKEDGADGAWEACSHPLCS